MSGPVSMLMIFACRTVEQKPNLVQDPPKAVSKLWTLQATRKKVICIRLTVMSTYSEKTILNTANVHQVNDTWRFPLACVEKKACEDTVVSTPTAWPKLFLTLSSHHCLNSSQKLFAAFSDWIHHRYCFECGRATPTQDEAQGTTRSCLQAREAGKTTILNAIQPHVDQSHSKKCDAPKQYQHHTWIVRALCQHLKWNALD